MKVEIAKLESGLAGYNDDGEVDDLEEIEREHAVKLLELKFHQVTDDIEMIEREIEMVKQMEMLRPA
ncbi:hypothetical protein H4R20_005991, partial [Coemansia guatemalensis]